MQGSLHKVGGGGCRLFAKASKTKLHAGPRPALPSRSLGLGSRRPRRQPPAAMILGTGIDLVEIQRIRDALQRQGPSFARRLLTAAEWAYCNKHPDAAPFVAARFAAKEAVAKAMGVGIGASLGWHDIEVVRLPSGQPSIRLSEAGQRELVRLGGRTVHLSLTHERGHAAAIAILEN